MSGMHSVWKPKRARDGHEEDNRVPRWEGNPSERGME